MSRAFISTRLAECGNEAIATEYGRRATGALRQSNAHRPAIFDWMLQVSILAGLRVTELQTALAKSARKIELAAAEIRELKLHDRI